MAVLPIIKFGHPTLRKQADEISEFSEKLRELAENMVDTMRVNEGIGLAATQVNELKRLFVIDLEAFDENLAPQAYVNPKIISAEGNESLEEGCLSIPEVRSEVDRSLKIEVEYQTLEGETVRETLEDLHARVFQHELDHLNGVLFIDRLPLLQRKLLEPKLTKLLEAHTIL
ncbi:MAG: peptide deformylase [Calditrichaceae bacterium]|nr:peptide deformylase [Calditrichia bacterium]NUQ43034.1 peptide deformylase [Calditrichaceae bacterium]